MSDHAKESLFAMDVMCTINLCRAPVPHPLQHWLPEPRRLALIVSDSLWPPLPRLNRQIAVRNL